MTDSSTIGHTVPGMGEKHARQVIEMLQARLHARTWRTRTGR